MSGFMEWVTHGIKHRRFEVSRRRAVCVIASVVLLAGVAVSYLMLVTQTAVRAYRVEQLRAELLRLQKENEQLEVDVARESAVFSLMKRAADLGLAPAGRMEFLSVADDPTEVESR